MAYDDWKCMAPEGDDLDLDLLGEEEPRHIEGDALALEILMDDSLTEDEQQSLLSEAAAKYSRWLDSRGF